MQPTRQSGADHWTRRTPDKIKRGPAAAGAKLSEAQIVEIYIALDRGSSKTHLADRFGVSRITIWRLDKARKATKAT